MASFKKTPFEVVGIPSKCEHKESDRGHSYVVEYTTPYGMVGGKVGADVFQQAEQLQDEGFVLLEVIPVQEQVRGEFNKGGFWHQLHIRKVAKLVQTSARPA